MKRVKNMRRRWKVAAVVAVATLAATTASFAYFVAAGSGSTSASVASPDDVTITPGTAAGQLYPGGSGDVVATISNPNPFSVRINSLVLDTSSPNPTGFSVDSGHPSCVNTGLSYTTQTDGGAGWTVPAQVGSVPGTLDVTVTGALQMAANADNGCQGATFSVYLKTGP
jgi:hypothetical protein